MLNGKEISMDIEQNQRGAMWINFIKEIIV